MYPIQFNYISSDGRIVFPTPHGLNTNDIVIITGLTTLNDPLNNNILAQINNPRGVKITKINTTIISIGVNFSQIITPDTNSLPLILFYSNMFRFPIEIGYHGKEDDYGTYQ
jgi:hypothetical protein